MHANKDVIIKCIVVDANPIIIDSIKSYLNRIEHVKLIASFSDPIDAISFLKKNKIDLAFLEAGLFCSTWVKISKKIEHVPQLIFTSDDAKFRMGTFKLNATYYLEKPIVFNDFLKGIHKVKNRYKQLNPTIANMISAGAKETKKEEDIILIKTEHETISLKISEIKYIQTVKGLTKIFRSNNSEPIITSLELDKVLINLPDYFWQIHKSYVINTCLTSKVLKRKVIIDNMHIPIGETYNEVVLKRLGV